MEFLTVFQFKKIPKNLKNQLQNAPKGGAQGLFQFSLGPPKRRFCVEGLSKSHVGFFRDLRRAKG